MSSVETLLTAEDYADQPDSGPTELVRGKVVTANPPKPRHGEICVQIAYLLRRYLEGNDVGRVVGNDSAIITERNPDTVRGADVAFYSYDRVPKGPLSNEYLSVAPDLVFEVLSPGDRRTDVLAKVAEYLACGVTAVCLLDAAKKTAELFDADDTHLLNADDELTFPEILPRFAVPVGKLFE